MELSISLYEFVNILVGAAILISLAVASLLAFQLTKESSSGDRWAKSFLSLLLIFAALTVFYQILSGIDLPELWNDLLDFAPLLYTFGFGPHIYLYVIAKLRPKFRLRWRHAPHSVYCQLDRNSL